MMAELPKGTCKPVRKMAPGWGAAFAQGVVEMRKPSGQTLWSRRRAGLTIAAVLAVLLVATVMVAPASKTAAATASNTGEGIDQAEALGHRVDVEGADVVAHQLVVHRNARQVTGGRTGRHDDLLGGDDLFTDLDLPATVGLADEAAVAGQEGDLVLLEQALDAAGELLDDLMFSFVNKLLFSCQKEYPKNLFRLV